MSVVIICSLAIWLAYTKGRNAALATTLASIQTNRPPVVAVTNAPVSVQTNAPPSQVDLLAAEVRALKAANEEREAMVKRLLALNEEVRRERATNVITVPVTVIVTNSPPSAPQVPSKESKKGGTVLMEKSQKSKTRVPMYTVTNYTSSVTVTGTNTVSQTNTSVQNFLRPPRRSLLGYILGGSAGPISTDTPSGNSVQQGYPPTPVIIVEQPAYGYGYPYGYGGGYGYPYARMPVYGQSCDRRLFGVRFHTR